MLAIAAVVFIFAMVTVMLIRAGSRAAPTPPIVPARTQLTRKWARAMFFNRLISLEELNHFYSILPEDLPEDPKLPK